jgi:hypothetical protein
VHTNEPTNTFVVIDINTGKTFAEFTSSAFSYFHVANSFEYEENNQKYIAIDIITYGLEGAWNAFASEYLVCVTFIIQYNFLTVTL